MNASKFGIAIDAMRTSASIVLGQLSVIVVTVFAATIAVVIENLNFIGDVAVFRGEVFQRQLSLASSDS